MSLLDAIFRGVAQGTSFGFADELSGLAGLTAGKAGLVPDAGYEFYRDGARERDKKSFQDHPYLNAAGELLAGLALGSRLPPTQNTQAGLAALYSVGSQDKDNEVKSIEDYANPSSMYGNARNPWSGMAGTIIKFPSKQSANVARKSNNEKIAKNQDFRDRVNYGLDKLEDFKNQYFQSDYRKNWYSNKWKEGNKTLEDSFKWNRRDFNEEFKEEMLNMETFYKEKLDKKEITEKDFIQIRRWVDGMIK
jgi:hypothetical protein